MEPEQYLPAGSQIGRALGMATWVTGYTTGGGVKMIAFVQLLLIMIMTAVAVTAISPEVLLRLWGRDWSKVQIW